MKFLTFKNGDQLPVLGLGTWKSKPGEVYQAVLWAIKSGYRHIDCAAVYMNEKEVGQALSQAMTDGLVKREELFITSKLWNNAHRKEDVKGALKQTLKDLNLDYLDLYLIHWPISFKSGISFAQTREEFYTYQDVPLSSTWQGMQDMKNLKLVRHIGVSNFNIRNLKELINVGGQGPEMNQIEMHPFLPQKKLVEFCKNNNILLTAYSPLGSQDRSKAIKKADEPSLLNDPEIATLAMKYNVTAGQLLIAFSINRDIAVIPKSINESRIAENFASYQIQIQEEDMGLLLNMEKNYRFIDGTFFTGTQSPYELSDLWEEEG